MKALMMILGVFACIGCGEGQDPAEAPIEAQPLQVRFSWPAAPQVEVAIIEIEEVGCDGAPLEAPIVDEARFYPRPDQPRPEGAPPLWASADFTFSVPAGCYRVRTALTTASGGPAAGCRPADEVSVEVTEGRNAVALSGVCKPPAP